MKIELKSIKFSESLSEETNAFTANIYINDKKVGYCKNDGQGGCTDYNADSRELRPIIAEAEAYCKTLPPEIWRGKEFPQSLESVINNQLENWLTAKAVAKAKKRMNKLMTTAILFGVPNGNEFSYINNKVNHSKVPTPVLQIFVDKIKAKHCTDGKVILNTNLKELGVNI